MKIRSFIGFMLVSALLQACTKDNTIPCIKDAFDGMKSGHLRGYIWQYSYKGRLVYYVSIDGFAINYTIYDANCNVLCESYGLCQDSILNSNSLTDKVVIIENH